MIFGNSYLFRVPLWHVLAVALLPWQAFAGKSSECVDRVAPARGHAPSSRVSRPPPKLTAAERKKIASKKYNDLYRKLLADSQYRSVSAEAEGLKAFGAEAGVHPNGVAGVIQLLRNRGNEAVARERKSCGKSFDYSPRLGPVRNQDSVGWCYAFTLADQMSFITGKRISGAAIAVNYNSKYRWIYRLFEPYCGEAEAGWGGTEVEAALLSWKSGLCLESQFPSENNGPGRIYDKIVAIEKARKSGNADTFKACSLNLMPSLKHHDIMEVLRTSSQEELIKSLSDKACTNRVPMPPLKPRYYPSELFSPASLIQKIDEALASGKLPSIAYPSEMLFNADSSIRKSAHASSVVGRKWDTKKNECVYLIRNSYGPGCQQYDRRHECKNGHIWIPKSVLVKGVNSVTVFR